MGFFSKVWKGAKKIVKKTFKAIGSGLKKMWKNKWVRGAIIAAAVIGTGMWAAGALGASTLGAGGVVGSTVSAGTGTLATTGAGASTLGGAMAGGTGWSVAGLAPVATTVATATPAATGILGTMASGAATIGKGLSATGAWLGANPGAASLLGGGVMNSANMIAKGKQADEERAYQEKIWGRQGAFGISNDGSDQGGMGSIDLMAGASPQQQPQFQPEQSGGILGNQYAAQPYGQPAQAYQPQPYQMPTPKQRVRWDQQSKGWVNS